MSIYSIDKIYKHIYADLHYIAMHIVPKKWYLKRTFKRLVGDPLDLDDPRTFNEKLQWLKLYDHNPLYTKMVDKYEMKRYVADIIGDEYIVPVLGVWDNFADIEFEKLPKRFVLKCNNDSGSVVICRDKSVFDKKNAKKLLEKSMHYNYYYNGSFEWPYKDVKAKIFAEELLNDGSGDALVDYKFFCFNGKAKLMYISRDESSNPTTDFFDMDFNHLPIRMKDPNSECPPAKPRCFFKMKKIAEILSQNIPHVRVDFFYVNDKIYVGELTFYHSAGFSRVYPDEWNTIMGDWIDIGIKDR